MKKTKLYLSKLSISQLYHLIFNNTKWPSITKFKKHKAVDHSNNFYISPYKFYNKWINKSGIYKITFLNFKLFTYYGSSKNLGSRLKYHYYTSPNKDNFLGIFLNYFTWKLFSVTII
jgi:hypothetical protein